MTQEDSGQRRREDDFQLNPENGETELYPDQDRRRTKRSRLSRTPGRTWLRRFRHPIIGLSLAGAAAPLINAQSNIDRVPGPGEDTSAKPTEADQARLAAQAESKGDVEDQLASKIAEKTGGSRRAEVVDSAMQAYGISEKLATDIYEIAQDEGIDPKIAYGLVKTESAFKNRAVSHVGARGLTQVMPRTARWMVPGTKADDLYDQQTNLRLGFRYLNQMIDKYKGDVRLALLAYNRGPGTVDKVLRRGGNPNNGYADKVFRFSKEV